MIINPFNNQNILISKPKSISIGGFSFGGGSKTTKSITEGDFSTGDNAVGVTKTTGDVTITNVSQDSQLIRDALSVGAQATTDAGINNLALIEGGQKLNEIAFDTSVDLFSQATDTIKNTNSDVLDLGALTIDRGLQLAEDSTLASFDITAENLDAQRKNFDNILSSQNAISSRALDIAKESNRGQGENVLLKLSNLLIVGAVVTGAVLIFKK